MLAAEQSCPRGRRRESDRAARAGRRLRHARAAARRGTQPARRRERGHRRMRSGRGSLQPVRSPSPTSMRASGWRSSASSRSIPPPEATLEAASVRGGGTGARGAAGRPRCSCPTAAIAVAIATFLRTGLHSTGSARAAIDLARRTGGGPAFGDGPRYTLAFQLGRTDRRDEARAHVERADRRGRRARGPRSRLAAVSARAGGSKRRCLGRGDPTLRRGDGSRATRPARRARAVLPDHSRRGRRLQG